MSFFGPDLRFARSAAAPLYVTGLAWNKNTGEILFAGSIQSREAAGYAFHVFDRSGRYVRSFGEERGMTSLPSDRLARAIFQTPKGEIVAVTMGGRYSVEVWDWTGKLHGRWDRHTEWFGEPTPEIPVAARVLSVTRDASGLVWTLIAVPKRNWKQGMRRLPGAAEDHYEVPDYDRVYDSYLEVLDLDRHEVVARLRNQRIYFGFVGPGLLARMQRAEDGTEQLAIYGIKLVKP